MADPATGKIVVIVLAVLHHDRRLADMAGGTHDNTVARHGHVLAHLRTAGLCEPAGLGSRGLDNDILAVGRALVEHGFAHLKNWRNLTKLHTEPARATRLLRALLALTNLEVNR
ncbi:hypothetical protein [Streptomyces sp. NPDC088757]|uniref:hypothetical protein n=1 Tax=Streptomyces sp. NPDC088757 TaxID=3365889 RepID=UPI0037F7D665